MTLDPGSIALLAGAGFVAGVVDAIAGGGGLITVPALLAAGVPPRLALGTNKGQAVFGSGAALLGYVRAGHVDRKRARITFPAGFGGALIGASLVLAVDPAILRPLVLVLLVGAALIVTFRRPRTDVERAPHAGLVRPVLIAGLIGAYDGFFGPGTGTFLILAFVELIGLSMAKATAEAKVVNFASNLASVALFSARGTVIWAVALPMAGAQLIGGWLGAQIAVRGGERVIRFVVLGVILALVLKLGTDLLGR
jgi:uncharacterized membrane protein YfcA